jgi:CheY-like chemotaxis protein
MGAWTFETRGRPAEILLIEDSHGDILLFREAWRRAEVANPLAIARDGEEALRLLRLEAAAVRPRADLILLDLNLPRMDGRGVLHAMAADPELANIPVVVLTGSAGACDDLRDRGLKVAGHIEKPIAIDRLGEIVAAIAGFRVTVSLPAVEPNHAG